MGRDKALISFWSSPENIFAFFALAGGLLLIALIPPLGGGNETFNFHRAVAVASGHVLVEPASVPSGIVRFLETGGNQFPQGATPPYSYSQQQLEELASIELDPDTTGTLAPDPIAVLHPFSYLPQVPVLWLAELLALPPLAWLYLGRLAGLAAGVMLTYFAIRAMPVHKHGLAAIALLPTILFSRSTFDADQFTNGLAFFFLASALREVSSGELIKRRKLIQLALAAFIMAQSKSAYLLLPLVTFAVPRGSFASVGGKVAGCSAIILPGLIGSLAWMITLKHTYFSGIRYQTWAGAVFPDGQSSLILSNPIDYAGVVLRTVFSTPLIPESLVGLVGIFGPPVMMPPLYYAVLPVAVGAVLIATPKTAAPALLRRSVGLLALFLTLCGTLIVLTLLYLQWNPLGAATIKGFQGRYLYPFVPLLLLLIPSAGREVFGRGALEWLAAVGLISVGGTWWVTYLTYLA